MTNRTASLNHVTQSDAAYEAGHFEPLPSTLDTIAAIRAQNEVWRIEAERAEIRAALDVAKAEMQGERMERFEDSHYSVSWFLESTNLVDLALAQAHRCAAVALSHQIVAHL